MRSLGLDSASINISTLQVQISCCKTTNTTPTSIRIHCIVANPASLWDSQFLRCELELGLSEGGLLTTGSILRTMKEMEIVRSGTVVTIQNWSFNAMPPLCLWMNALPLVINIPTSALQEAWAGIPPVLIFEYLRINTNHLQSTTSATVNGLLSLLGLAQMATVQLFAETNANHSSADHAMDSLEFECSSNELSLDSLWILVVCL